MLQGFATGLFLCSFQLVFAFGVENAAYLIEHLSRNSPFAFAQDPVDPSWFYVDNSVITNGARLPIINLLASTCSLVLLGFICKSDNLGTLMSPSPIALLCFPNLRPEVMSSHGVEKVTRRPAGF
jgi:hypothetical protein